MQAARSLRDRKKNKKKEKRHAAPEPSTSSTTTDGAKATSRDVRSSTAASSTVSAESASETKGQNTWRQVRHPAPKRLHARDPHDVKETKQQQQQQQQQQRQQQRRQQRQSETSSSSSDDEQKQDNGSGVRAGPAAMAAAAAAVVVVDSASVAEDGGGSGGSGGGGDGTEPAKSFDIVSQCTARLGRHQAEVTVKFSRADRCFEFDILATGLSARLQSSVPVSRDLAEQTWQLLQIVQARGSDEVRKTVAGVASCLTLDDGLLGGYPGGGGGGGGVDSGSEGRRRRRRPTSEGDTRAGGSPIAIPRVRHDMRRLESVIATEIRRVTHATQPLSTMELEQRLRADMETHDDGRPARAAVRAQAAYRGHFVRKFGRERSLRVVHEAHAAREAAKEQQARHTRDHNAFKVQRAIRTFLVRKAVNQLDVMTRVAAAETLRPAAGSFDPLDMTIEEQDSADLPDAPRLIPVPDDRYRDLSSGVDEAIASARAAGEIDANRIVRDAEEGVASLKRTLELSAEAQKLDLQREFQRLEKELRTKVQAQRAELMAESARLRFVVTARAKEQRVLARQEAQRLRKDAEAEVQRMRTEAEADIARMKQRMLEEARRQIQEEAEASKAALHESLQARMSTLFTQHEHPLF